MKIQLNKKAKFSIFLLIITSLVLLSAKLSEKDDFELLKNLTIYHDVVRDLRLYYVDDKDVSKLVSQSIDDMLDKLDPYTVFYPESQIEEYTIMTTGSYAGIGATVSEIDGKLVITEINKNQAANIAGLKIGDQIISVNQKKIINLKNENLNILLSGEPGSKLSLIIERNKSEILPFNLTRTKIENKNITYSTITPKKNIYIKLASFMPNAADDILKEIEKYQKQEKCKGIILDLRDNPGGLLIEAVKIVNLFVEKGELIVSTKGKDAEKNTNFYTTNNAYDTNIPITVLVNNMSASASEIVAGSLQDLDRAVVIGQRTYGKGLVQITKDLSYNSKIKITIAKYYIPSGRCIQIKDYSHRNSSGAVGNIPDSLIQSFKTKNGRVVFDGGGVIPDIKDNDEENEKFLKFVQENFLIFKYGCEISNSLNSEEKTSDYNISDKLYYEFENYIQTSKTIFESDAQKQLLGLKNNINLENNSNKTEIISELNIIEKKITPNISLYLQKYVNILKPQIENEVKKHFLFTEDLYYSNLKNDLLVNKAENILENSNQYSVILRKNK